VKALAPQVRKTRNLAVTAYIGLGANLGDPALAVRNAIAAIAGLPGVQGAQASSLYGSAPVDAGGADYVNAVLQVQTSLSAPQLLTALQAIEQQAGRERSFKNAPRTLDLDLLLYGTQKIATPNLVVPHPRMWERAFVLLPLAELEASLVSADQLAAVKHQKAWQIH
jgi:2-amino-4-hydroxy-6-hydroxymethyldihydropteridine diphosphokinase